MRNNTQFVGSIGALPPLASQISLIFGFDSLAICSSSLAFDWDIRPLLLRSAMHWSACSHQPTHALVASLCNGRPQVGHFTSNSSLKNSTSPPQLGHVLMAIPWGWVRLSTPGQCLNTSCCTCGLQYQFINDAGCFL